MEGLVGRGQELRDEVWIRGVEARTPPPFDFAQGKLAGETPALRIAREREKVKTPTLSPPKTRRQGWGTPLLTPAWKT
jgi:hypothetical protein